MLERLQQAMQKEQRFLDWASHELRTPLGVLKMELELALARSRTPEELKEALANALAETDRVVHLAEHLLVLSRTRAGQMVLHREDTPVDSILERAAASHRARAQAEGMAVSVESGDALRARVDRERLRQALDDLIDNSLRHARPGTNVRLSAHRSDGRLLVTVRDDGPGFPPDLLDGDGEGSASGTGLGLSVVRAIAEAHGGALRLRNEVPRGASASIELPT
jgi:signal transduction histidine kinase